MRLNYPLLLVFLVSLCAFGFADTELQTLARSAASKDRIESESAIRALRSNKQAGLDALFEAFQKEIDRHNQTGTPAQNWGRISYALDQVAMQKDAYSARLFWHTELSEAIADSKRAGKPILSLRLLGGLNEEYSCANSRFFRSILYSDPAVAKTLRENYVLHWRSVRPAPKITIDFGDGRKLVRTITGNSIHYVLDSEGRVVDALPGLYSPELFQNYLTELNTLVLGGKVSPAAVTSYRLAKANALVKDWQERMAFLGKDMQNSTPVIAAGPENPVRALAIDAAPRAVTKMAIERPAVLSLLPQIERLRANTEVDDWMPLAKISGTVRLSDESLALIRSKSGAIGDEEFNGLIENLKDYVALDSVQNEYRFHATILSWLNPGNSLDVEEFNRLIYTELFLTPDSDKWLGLYSSDIYSAIENNGIVK